MRVLVPYVRLHSETERAAMLATKPSKGDWAEATVRFVHTAGADSYWQTLADAWERGESFIVLEQDKVPAPGLLAELWECPERWCSVRTPMRGSERPAEYPSLSCTKFDASLMAAYPDLLEHVGELDLGFGVKEWSRLDLAIAGLLGGRGFEAHYHDGLVEHLHDV